METKDIILDLRTKKRLSQEELAEKVFVTRQAVSRWENGETIPNIETLKLLSKFFDVSINTLLGSCINPFSYLLSSDSEISVNSDNFFIDKFLPILFSFNIGPNNLIKISPFFLSWTFTWYF